MTNMKKLLTVGAIVLAVAVTAITSFAASEYNSPAEALAALTNKTEEQILQEKKETGSYGAIAAENGVLEQFKAEMYEMKKDRIEAKVADGTLTREKADEILKAIEDKMANCDGTGQPGKFENFGIRSGKGNGNGMRNGEGRGNRQGMGKGMCGGQG